MRGELHGAVRKFGFLSVALMSVCGSAFGQESVQTRAQGYERAHSQQQVPAAVEQQQFYHESGTAGRIGLGASPFHPEGPGNFTHR